MTHKEYTQALKIADARMKDQKGHQFVQILKTRCQYCGRSPAQVGNKRCGGWFQCFVDRLSIVLSEMGVIEK